jgi:hypothetical protein
MLTEAMQQAAWLMLEELKANRLEVVLVKSKRDPRVKIRQVVNANPKWYSELCEQHKQARKRYRRPRTIIKRWWTIRVLEKFVDGSIRLNDPYPQRLLPFIEDIAQQFQNF